MEPELAATRYGARPSTSPLHPPEADRARRTSSTPIPISRSEEHTSELQSHVNLVCRLLLEKKNSFIHIHTGHLTVVEVLDFSRTLCFIRGFLRVHTNDAAQVRAAFPGSFLPPNIRLVHALG